MNKAGRVKWKILAVHWESNLGPLTWATSALPTELRQPHNHRDFIIPYIYCTSGIECFSFTPGSHYVCATHAVYIEDCEVLMVVRYLLVLHWTAEPLPMTLQRLRFACILNEQWISMCSLWNCMSCELWIWKACLRQKVTI